jgi:hypothetical protein
MDGVFRPVDAALAFSAASAAPRVLRAEAGGAVAWAALVAVPGQGGVWQALFATKQQALDALAAAGVTPPPPCDE